MRWKNSSIRYSPLLKHIHHECNLQQKFSLDTGIVFTCICMKHNTENIITFVQQFHIFNQTQGRNSANTQQLQHHHYTKGPSVNPTCLSFLGCQTGTSFILWWNCGNTKERNGTLFNLLVVASETGASVSPSTQVGQVDFLVTVHRKYFSTITQRNQACHMKNWEFPKLEIFLETFFRHVLFYKLRS